MSIADASVTEGNTGTSTVTFTVSTADAAGNKTPFTVDYATVAGGAQPATPGADYVATSGTLSFPAATRSRTFTVTVNGDLIDEPAETFLVQLSNSSGPVILDGEAVGTINDNDTASVVINNVSVPEGNSGTTDAIFTVSLATPYYRDFTVNWATAAGVTNPATEGVDYLAGSGTLTFLAGTTSQTLPVSVVGDLIDEPNETFGVVLSGSTGPTISDSRGDGTITDDDTLTIDIADVKVVEGNSGTTPATFTLTVSRDHAQTVTVNAATSAGGPTPPAATAGTDFTALPSTLADLRPGRPVPAGVGVRHRRHHRRGRQRVLRAELERPHRRARSSPGRRRSASSSTTTRPGRSRSRRWRSRWRRLSAGRSTRPSP